MGPQRRRQRLIGLLPAFGPAMVWIIQPFTVGALIGDALNSTGSDFRTAASWMAWLSWAAILVILAVPQPLTLTLGRIGAAAILPTALWAAANTDSDALVIVGVSSAIVAALAPLFPAVGERFIDAASYGDEQRYPLRPPGQVLLFLVVPTWAVSVAAISAGPLLLAAHRWGFGAAAILIGLPISLVGYRAMSRLTSRFLVFVPHGIVIHDLVNLAEPVLVKVHEISTFGPARVDASTTDLTSQALGLALELRFVEPIGLPIVIGRDEAEETTVDSLMVSPSRPAAVLQTAARRGFNIG